MKNFNTFEFEKAAKQLNLDGAVKEIFGNDVVLYYDRWWPSMLLPRKLALTKKFSMVPLWYLQFLADINPEKIVDIGCGANLFKPVIEKIYNCECYGIDPDRDNTFANEVGFFDADFSKIHTEDYLCAFSINALHFLPLSDMTKRIEEFYNVIAKGGRGFLALNSARMLERTDPQWLVDTFDTKMPTAVQVQDYVQKQLSTLDINFIVIDLLITEVSDEFMDGNIRMVFKK